MIGHFVLDLFSGHPHHIFDAETQQIGLGNYATNAFLAVGIEAIFVLSFFGITFVKMPKMEFSELLITKPPL